MACYSTFLFLAFYFLVRQSLQRYRFASRYQIILTYIVRITFYLLVDTSVLRTLNVNFEFVYFELLRCYFCIYTLSAPLF
jgi:hypothetical protein